MIAKPKVLVSKGIQQLPALQPVVTYINIPLPSTHWGCAIGDRIAMTKRKATNEITQQNKKFNI